jgi:trk system potassium uptake protein TrkH
MNLTRVARLLAGFVLFFALVQIVPLMFALGEERVPYDTVAAFAGSIGVGAVVALLLWLAGHGADLDFRRKEGLTVVAFAWMLASVLGAIPFVWSGTLASGVDAVFETVSGLTTTGASVFGSRSTPAIEALPQSILFWRALLQFIGGMGIILLFIIVLPAMGVTGKNLLVSEQTGVTTEIGEPRMRDHARALFRCYLVLNVAVALGYWLAGLSLFDAVCHAFTTLSTGGYSPRNLSLGAYDKVAVEVVAIVGMFLGGCNFAWLLALARGGLRNATDVWRTPELRCYVLVLSCAIVITTLSLWISGGRVPDASGPREYAAFGRCLRDAAFNVTSMFTSTGFANADFQNWPMVALFVITFGMLIGSCTGSTAGGMKMLRVLVCAKLATFHGRRFMRPKSVERLKVGGDVVPDPVVTAIVAVVLLWLAVTGIGCFVFALDSRLDALSCITASATLMGNTGPALSAVLPHDGALVVANRGDVNLGPYGSFGDLTAFAKAFGSVLMLLGRLEIVTLLVLLSPRFWKS